MSKALIEEREDWVRLALQSVKCPICEKPTAWKDNPYRPFCSERCKIIDLGNWASEDYRISAPLKDASEEAEQQQD